MVDTFDRDKVRKLAEECYRALINEEEGERKRRARQYAILKRSATALLNAAIGVGVEPRLITQIATIRSEISRGKPLRGIRLVHAQKEV